MIIYLEMTNKTEYEVLKEICDKIWLTKVKRSLIGSYFDTILWSIYNTYINAVSKIFVFVFTIGLLYIKKEEKILKEFKKMRREREVGTGKYFITVYRVKHCIALPTIIKKIAAFHHKLHVLYS